MNFLTVYFLGFLFMVNSSRKNNFIKFMNRIQRLLFDEYSDFEDVVLIESPFVEVTKSGKGIRQLQIGLTNTKLIIAADVLKSEFCCLNFPGRQDTDLENFELLALFPIGVVSLSVFQKRRRQVLKARFHDGNPEHNLKIVYYELGGTDRLKMWKVWCERVSVLSIHRHGGSSTEPSVGSSTSEGSIFVRNSKVWQLYGVQSRHSRSTISTEASNQELTQFNNSPCLLSAKLSSVPSKYLNDLQTLYQRQNLAATSSSSINSWIRPKSKSSLTRYIQQAVNNRDAWATQTNARLNENYYINCLTVMELVTKVWEKKLMADMKSLNEKCIKGYEVCPCPDLLFSLCLSYNADKPTTVRNMQLKKSRSFLNIFTKNFDEFNEPLKGSKSLDCIDDRLHSAQKDDDEILYFWTTEFWYKPDKINKRISSSLSKLSNKWKKRYSFIFKKSKNFKDDKNVKKIMSILELNKEISLMDLSSSALACELTMIDIRLFLKIPKQELKICQKQGTPKNCKNLVTWLAFSHRICCLMVTEILKSPTVQTRSRLIARLINTCERTHTIKNYNGTRNLLSALQSLPIYRLNLTWAYFKKYHPTPYGAFKQLSREYLSSLEPMHFTTMPYLVTTGYLLSAIFTVEGEGEKKDKVKEQVKLTVQTAEEILLISQAAAKRYNLSGCSIARQFLLRKMYNELWVNYQMSFDVEAFNY